MVNNMRHLPWIGALVIALLVGVLAAACGESATPEATQTAPSSAATPTLHPLGSGGYPATSPTPGATQTVPGSTATPTPVSDDRPGGIQGIVADPAGNPVAGMRVGIISGTAAFPEIGAETDDEGHYQIGSVPPGTFQVAVHGRDGGKIGQESVTVTSGELATLDFSIPAAGRSPTDGLCLPALPLAVSVGDTWTISGPVTLPEGFPTELPVGAAEASSTFTVSAIGTTTYAGGRGDAPIEHPTIQLKVTNVTRDEDGNVLSTEDDPRIARGISWTPASVSNLGPVLTPDWECHQKAWLEAGLQQRSPLSVREFCRRA